MADPRYGWLRSRLTLRRRSHTCNICGRASYVPLNELEREHPSCESCGSTPRWRGIIHALSLGLFAESLPIRQFPRRPEIRGIGLSDSDGYATRLAAKLGYTNTFLHREPRLDIVAPDPALNGTLDFVIASEVFEHVDRPVERVFESTRRLLKPDGTLVLSVPYVFGDATIERFPEMRDYAIVDRGGERVLAGTTLDGEAVEFRDLVFHGGDGATLEMRLFALNSLLEQLAAASFADVRVLGDEPRYGVVWPEAWSRPILARAS